jgi:hypothetical protein
MPGFVGCHGQWGNGDNGCGQAQEGAETPPNATEPNAAGLEQEGQDTQYGVDDGRDQ